MKNNTTTTPLADSNAIGFSFLASVANIARAEVIDGIETLDVTFADDGRHYGKMKLELASIKEMMHAYLEGEALTGKQLSTAKRQATAWVKKNIVANAWGGGVNVITTEGYETLTRRIVAGI